MVENRNITGIVLAGGKSSRMGSDKGLLTMNSKMFIEYVVDALKPLVDDIIIVSNNKAYDQFAFERVADCLKDSGPLAGLYSGLYHSKTEFNLVLSCDIPMITTEVLNKLVDTDYKNYDVVQIQSEHKTMPLIAIYKKTCLNKCLELLKQDERRLRFAVSQLNTKTVIIDTEWSKLVRNVNTVEQLIDVRNEVEH